MATYPPSQNQLDLASGLAVDAAGNVGVSGYEQSATGAGPNYVLVKYAPSGQLLWEARYPARGGTNRLTDVAVDAAGNFYVSGCSVTSSPLGESFTVLKYSPSGQQFWVANYEGPANPFLQPIKVVVDAASNVYVMGNAALKYSPTGQLLWRVMGGTDLVVDAAGNVYVTGSTTTKYAPSGQPLWQVPTAGTTVDVDAAGQVYVSGTVSSTTSNTDYAARKYDAATGQLLWETRYDGADNGQDEVVDAAVDATGNLYVTGTSFTTSRGGVYLTLKISSGGQVLWHAPSRETGVGRESARRLVLDAAGNVYVSGNAVNLATSLSDYLTFKYEGATGQPLWNRRYTTTIVRDREDQMADLALDALGNVYVTGTTFFSGIFVAIFTTVKYEQHSVQLGWQVRFTGAGRSAEVGKDVVSDAAGNVYVTGYAYNGRNYDYATAKYSRTGQQLWQARYNGPADNEDLPTNVVVDTAGNVYVSGTSYSATESDYATIKYSPTGQQLWVARYNGPASGYDLAAKVEVDRAGNVYVTGSSDNGSNGSYDYATLKYASDGQLVWQARYNGPAGSFDLAADVVVDTAGNVYVTGTTYSSSSSDYATLKYAGPSGQQLWEQLYNGATNGYDEAAKVTLIAASGNVVVTGTSDGGASTGYDFATLVYKGASGQPAWSSRYNDPGNGDDVVADVAVTNQGEVVVAGTSYGGRSADYSIVRYAGSSGALVWRSRYDGPAASYDEVKAVAVDAAGNAYLTGLSYNADGSNDYATVKYAARPPTGVGRRLWEQRYNGAGNSYDEAAAVTVDEANNVYVTGFSFGAGTGYDFATLQYRQSTGSAPLMAASSTLMGTGRAPLTTAAPIRLGPELTVYPNPASGPTIVRFCPAHDGPAQVLVYNQLGQQVAALYEGPVRQGQHYELALDSQKLAPGLYTCSLRVNGQRETVRLLIQP
ncbi:T9SS type A sorting domain-containing protein [uncultured Hymenobacter sp.]|uniref:T9SS type A sorting domain-containing protein n=1 Tax=uncultured Hymenobacter sp. TaxID=170016 RepID=UPI0035CAB5FB